MNYVNSHNSRILFPRWLTSPSQSGLQVQVGGHNLLSTVLSGAGCGWHTRVGHTNTDGSVQVGVWRLVSCAFGPLAFLGQAPFSLFLAL